MAGARQYLSMNGALMQVNVRLPACGHPEIAAPRLLFDTGLITTLGFDQYATSSDGIRFLRRVPETAGTPQMIHVIANWPTLLRQAP